MIENIIRQNLRNMFFMIPETKAYNNSITFRLRLSDAKMVTKATLKKWLKDYDVTILRERGNIWGSVQDYVDYEIIWR